jgi:cation diffusion facilitator CzcD-associated flavoprotein CzcO
MYHRFLRVGTKGRRLLSNTAAQGLLKRVGVVGAGPSGFYAAKYLLKELGDDSRLDMFEK